MPALQGQGRVDVDGDLAVGRLVRMEVTVEREVSGLADRLGHPAMRPSSRPTRSNAASAVSSISSVCAAVTIVRMRALSSATVGKTTGWAKTPSSRSRSLNRPAVGRVAHHHRRDRRLADARVEAEPGQLALEPARVRPEPLDELRLLLEDADRLAAGRGDGRRVGGREEERPRALDEDVAEGLRAGDVAAEHADRLARACPTWMATRPWSPKWSTVPRPFRPRTPDAWASSTKTAASYSSATSTIAGSGAMSPSI